MTERTLTVTILTDEEFEVLHKRATAEWRTDEQQLNAEVQRLLRARPTAAAPGQPRQARGPRRERAA